MKRLPAFALLEVALALLILGALGTLGLQTYTHLITTQKIKKTEEKLESLLKVIGSYVRLNGRLPCPSNPNTQSTGYGKAYPSCRSGTDFVGAVPFKTLGVGADFALDGYGHQISYAINSDLALSETEISVAANKIEPFCQVESSTQALTILGPGGMPLMETGTSQFGAIVVISHGKSGSGAYNKEGTITPAAGTEKSENAARTRRFYDMPRSKDFDDHVKWASRDNLMALWGGIPCVR